MKTIDPVDQSVRAEYVRWMKADSARRSDRAQGVERVHPHGLFVIRREYKSGGMMVWAVMTPEGRKVAFLEFGKAMNFVQNGIERRFNAYLAMKAEQLWRTV